MMLRAHGAGVGWRIWVINTKYIFLMQRQMKKDPCFSVFFTMRWDEGWPWETVTVELENVR